MNQEPPEGFHTLTPFLLFKDAQKAIDFYRRALGARMRFVMPGPEGRGVMYAELQIGDSILMCGEEGPHSPGRSAETMGGSPVSFYIYVEDVEEAFATAVAAGAKVQTEIAEMFWGDRMGTVSDPFGYSWSLAIHNRNLSMAELHAGARAALAAMQGG